MGGSASACSAVASSDVGRAERVVLEAIVGLAVDTLAEVTAASLTLVGKAAPVSTVTSDPRLRHVVECQFAEGRGPFMRAAGISHPVSIDDLRGAVDRSPPAAWRECALAEGFQAWLCVLVPVPEDRVAALDLFADKPTSWTGEVTAAVERLAEHAGEAIALARRQDLGPG